MSVRNFNFRLFTAMAVCLIGLKQSQAQIFHPNPALTFSPSLSVQETDFRTAFNANPNGGTPGTTGFSNLALVANGGAAFESSRIAASYGDDKLNNGVYGVGTPDVNNATRPWISGTNDGFAGVSLLFPSNIQAIGFGSRFDNRADGSFTLEYTTDSFFGIDLDISAQTAGLSWNTIGTLTSTTLGEFGRHLVSFAPIANVTGARIVVSTTVTPTTITEIEIYEGFNAPVPLIGDTVVFETNSEPNFALPSAFGSFPTIPAPSNSDYADQNSGNGAVMSVAVGSALALHPTDSGPVTRLNDGVIMDQDIDCCGVGGNGPNGVVDAVFFENLNNTGRFLMDLNDLVDVEKIATYAGIAACCQNRGSQIYSVYGSALENPDTTGVLSVNGDWVLIAQVSGGPALQTAAQITSSTGSLGEYRNLIFEVDSGGDGVHDFYGEFDVFGTVVPEPSSIVLAIFGVLGLGWFRFRRRS